MEKEKQKPERRQTGAKLDVELLRKFKVLAAERETTLGELIEEAMQDFLVKAEKQKEREQPHRKRENEGPSTSASNCLTVENK